MPDLSRELQRAQEVAREAGQRIVQMASEGVEVNLKGVDDVVTNIDLAVERFAREALGATFPDDELAGEEFGADVSGGRIWWIDPVDGTRNLARGIPMSTVSIGLQLEGEPVVGVIYDPYRDELFSAVKGGGVHLNGVAVGRSDTPTVAQSVIAAKATKDHIAQFSAIARTCLDTRRFATAALEMAYLAAGRLDAFIEYGLLPWDTAAGVVLISEAGGQLSDADGSTHTLESGCTLASNGHIHQELVELIASR